MTHREHLPKEEAQAFMHRIAQLEAEVQRLRGVLIRIEARNVDCEHVALLRRWASEALTLGRRAEELSCG